MCCHKKGKKNISRVLDEVVDDTNIVKERESINLSSPDWFLGEIVQQTVHTQILLVELHVHVHMCTCMHDQLVMAS